MMRGSSDPRFIPTDWMSLEMRRLTALNLKEFKRRYPENTRTCREQAFAGLSFDEVIRSDVAASRLLKLQVLVEEEIARLCSHYSWYKLLHMSRRIAPVRIGGITSWTTHLYRWVLTLAILKHGQVPQKDEYRRLNFPSGADKRPNLGTTFEDVVTVYQVEHLCLEYYMVTAALRRVWKRANLVVSPDLSWDSPSHEEVEDMIDLIDKRKAATGDPLSHFGTVAGTTALRHHDRVDPRLLIAYVPLLNTARKTIEIDETLSPTPALFNPNYLYVPYDLTGLAERLGGMRRLVENEYGFGPTYLISFLAALAQPHWLFYQGVDRLDKFYKLSQRAYQLVPKAAAKKGYGRLLRSIHQEHFGRISLDYAEHIAERLLQFFTINDRSIIDLWVRRPHALAIPILDKLLIDFSAIPYIIGTLLESLANASDRVGNQKGTDFEIAVRDTVLKHIPAQRLWLCRQNIHPPLGQREIDVSFTLEDTLVIVECKGIGFPQALEKGDRDHVEARWKQVKRYLEQVDSLAVNLSEWPTGSDYHLPDEVRFVLPVLCTPNPEYIPRRDVKYFLTDLIPRILTPSELSTLLESTDVAWLAHPCRVPVRT